MDDEEHGRSRAAARKLGKLSYVSSASSCDRIGKHGDSIADQRTGFDLQQDLLASLLESEVETAVPDLDLRRDHPRLFEPRNTSLLEQETGDVVRAVCVEHDRTPRRSVHSDDGKTGSPRRARFPLDQMEDRVGEQQLP